jgi:ACS family tartrate transporter-like MFS transporter
MHGRVWHLTAIYFTALLGFYSMIFWMPQFVKNLSSQYSNTTVGLLVMIPYLVGLPVMILVGRSSDRRLERRYHAAIPLMIAAVSLTLLGTSTSISVFLSVTLWCLVASGIYSLWGPFWSLPNEFLTGFSAAAGIALINCFGNLGGFVGPFAMGAIQSAHRKFSRWPCGRRHFSVHIGNIDTRLAEKHRARGGAVTMAQASPAVRPTAGIDP